MRTCNFCSAPISNRKHHCGHHCRVQSIRQQYIKQWLAGEVPGYVNNYILSLHVRHFLIEEAGYKCVSCGWGEVNPVSKKIPLHVDHIDGNAGNCIRSNLRVLCPNCHSLTPTYGALNRGKSLRKYNRNGGFV